MERAGTSPFKYRTGARERGIYQGMKILIIIKQECTFKCGGQNCTSLENERPAKYNFTLI
jgi:hypothetical protein